MGQFSLSITPTSPLIFTSAFRGTERGRLKSLAVATLGLDFIWGRMFLEVGTVIGGRTDEYKVAVFYSGYLSGNNTFLWTGDYPFEAAEEIYVRAKAITSLEIRVTGKIDFEDP